MHTSFLLKAKLKSNSGASLMVALLFFVICATIGSIILAAATASLGRLNNLKRDNQTYFATSSAAEIVRNSIEEKEITIIITNNPEIGSDTIVYSPDDTFLSKLLSERLTLSYQMPVFGYETTDVILSPSEAIASQSDNPRNFTISVNDTSIENSDILATDVSMYLDKELNLIINIKPHDEERQNLNNVEIVFRPKIKEKEAITENDNNQTINEDERETTRVKTLTISWIDPRITKGGLSW